MRKSKILICTLLISSLALSGCGAKKTSTNISKSVDAAAILTEVKTTQFFTDEAVPDDDVKKILSAGVNAPSAMNTQPWHFTAVTDSEVTQKLKDAMAGMKPPAGGKAPAPAAQDGEENAGGESAAPDGNTEKADGANEKPEGRPERPEGMPERPEGKHEKPEGMPERLEGKHEKPEGAPEKPEGAPEAPEGMPVGQIVKQVQHYKKLQKGFSNLSICEALG